MLLADDLARARRDPPDDRSAGGGGDQAALNTTSWTFLGFRDVEKLRLRYSRQPPSSVISGCVLAVASSKRMPGTTRPSISSTARGAAQCSPSTTRSSVSIEGWRRARRGRRPVVVRPVHAGAHHRCARGRQARSGSPRAARRLRLPCGSSPRRVPLTNGGPYMVCAALPRARRSRTRRRGQQQVSDVAGGAAFHVASSALTSPTKTRRRSPRWPRRRGGGGRHRRSRRSRPAGCRPGPRPLAEQLGAVVDDPELDQLFHPDAGGGGAGGGERVVDVTGRPLGEASAGSPARSRARTASPTSFTPETSREPDAASSTGTSTCRLRRSARSRSRCRSRLGSAAVVAVREHDDDIRWSVPHGTRAGSRAARCRGRDFRVKTLALGAQAVLGEPLRDPERPVRAAGRERGRGLCSRTARAVSTAAAPSKSGGSVGASSGEGARR